MNKINLDLLNQQIANCRKCPLYKTALHAVPGEGPMGAKLMFVGEAPGRNEDETGRPFVGRAGKLLTQLIEGIGLKRDDVFITSVIKHRPPKNRQPKPAELKACCHWFEMQLLLIKPKIVVPLGRFGMDYFLPNTTITHAHGRVFETKERTVFPIYHPAYGLRSTKALHAIKSDFSNLKRVLLERNIQKV